eukprot:scaffold1620_cov233-Pinguiococcus_pyrenoidosus.AAC.5
MAGRIAGVVAVAPEPLDLEMKPSEHPCHFGAHQIDLGAASADIPRSFRQLIQREASPCASQQSVDSNLQSANSMSHQRCATGN